MNEEPMFPQFEEEERRLKKQRRKEDLLFLAAIFFTGAFIAMMWSLWCNVPGMVTITSSK